MAKSRVPNQARIIGGQWRGRKIAFPDVPQLRPTPDRVRETLFNWLAPAICGAQCLDLFAGSGLLGLEARSRGAEHVVLVERQRVVVNALREAVDRLDTSGIEVVQSDAQQFLTLRPRPFDIVFADPPYQQNLLAVILPLLESGGWLAEHAWIYIEAEADGLPTLPEPWALRRSGKAGRVGYHLAERI